MSRRFFPAHRDHSEPLIVEALQKAGWHVWKTLPCDLLLWKEGYGFRTLENKTPFNKNGSPRKRKDQQAQDEFLALTKTPRVTTPEAALKAVQS